MCFSVPTLGWATGRASGLYKVGCWFVGGDYYKRFDWSFARLTAAVVTTTSIILSCNKTG